jgi:hypothetical protein
MIASEDPIPPSARRADLPEELEHGILRSLDKDPATRAPLVDLARAAARYAPERAQASLGRIEATIAGQDGKVREDLPVVQLGRGESRTRTTARRTLGRREGHPVLRTLFLAVVCAVSGVAVYQQWFRGIKTQSIINAASSVAASVEAALPLAPSAAASDSASAAAPSASAPPAASASAAPVASASASAAKTAPSAAPAKAHGTQHTHHAVKHRTH